MKAKNHIFFVMVAAIGCMDVNLLDDMQPFESDTAQSADTGTTHPVSDTSDEKSQPIEPPLPEESDVTAPAVLGNCSQSERSVSGVCEITGNASSWIWFQTDEPATVEGADEQLTSLSSQWATRHEMVVRKGPVPRDVPLQISDINGNQTSLTIAVDAIIEPAIAITEVLADCLGAEPDGEFVELSNIGYQDVDLSGWMIDDNGDRNGDTLPEGSVLSAGETAVIAGDRFPGSEGRIFLAGTSIGTSGLKNSESESIELFDALGVIQATYQNATQPPVEGVSFQRRHPLLPDETPELWILSPTHSASPGIP